MQDYFWFNRSFVIWTILIARKRERKRERERLNESRSWKFVGAEWGKKAGVIQIVKVNCDFYERTRRMNASFIGTKSSRWMGVSHKRRYLRVIPAAELKWPMNFLVTFFPLPFHSFYPRIFIVQPTVCSNFNEKLLKSTVFFSREIADINFLTRERTIIREYIWVKLHGKLPIFDDVKLCKFTYFKDFDKKKKRKEKKT